MYICMLVYVFMRICVCICIGVFVYVYTWKQSEVADFQIDPKSIHGKS